MRLPQYRIFAAWSTLLLDRKGDSATITRAMMIAIPLGYFVSIFLICAGLLGGFEALNNRPEGSTNAEFLVQSAAAAWPMIAGTALLLLIQIAKQICHDHNDENGQNHSLLLLIAFLANGDANRCAL